MPVRVVPYQRGISEIDDKIVEYLDEIAQMLGSNSSPPIDTGFLDASSYVKSERVNTFDQTWATGMYDSSKQNRIISRERADGPVMESGRYNAIAGWAATYAADVEELYDAFIYRTLNDTVNSLT